MLDFDSTASNLKTNAAIVKEEPKIDGISNFVKRAARSIRREDASHRNYDSHPNQGVHDSGKSADKKWYIRIQNGQRCNCTCLNYNDALIQGTSNAALPNNGTLPAQNSSQPQTSNEATDTSRLLSAAMNAGNAYSKMMPNMQVKNSAPGEPGDGQAQIAYGVAATASCTCVCAGIRNIVVPKGKNNFYTNIKDIRLMDNK